MLDETVHGGEATERTLHGVDCSKGGGMDLGELTMLENALRDLITKWERFFAGDLRVPPHIERERLARRLRMLAERPTKRSAERFRAEQLQHRFMTYAQNWERMLREREEGRTPGTARPGGPVPASNPDGERPASVHSATGPAALYERYVEARRALGEEVAVDRGAFEAQLAAQRERLEQKLGHGVEFDVRVEGGKVKLAARRAGDGSEE